MYGLTDGLQLAGGETDDIDTTRIERAFNRAIEHIHRQKAFEPTMLQDAPVRSLISELAAKLSEAISTGYEQSGTTPSAELTTSVKNNTGVFCGFKAFNEMVESAAQMFDENGVLKPYKQALKDVKTVNDNYNRFYLNAEYGFAETAAEMAARWEELSDDGGGRFLLQYRTMGDNRVRESHRKLHGITLPANDPFWDEYTPPNGWRCRCTVAKVRASKYEQSNPEAARQTGADATDGKFAKMFRFNPGKQKKIFGDYNAYTIRDCGDCLTKIELAARMPANQLCQACRIVREMQKEWAVKAAQPLKTADKGVKSWISETDYNRKIVSDALSSGRLYLTAQSVKRFLAHAKSAEAKWVLTTLCDNADALEHTGYTALGSGKDMTDTADKQNVTAKHKRGVIGYNTYDYCCNGSLWVIGMELTRHGKRTFEQPYFIAKKRLGK